MPSGGGVYSIDIESRLTPGLPGPTVRHIDGHADRFWALALASATARASRVTIEGATTGRRSATLTGFY